jgi:predicted small integral membrane protein
MNNMLSYKLNYLFVRHVLQSNDFSPFGKLVFGD